MWGALVLSVATGSSKQHAKPNGSGERRQQRTEREGPEKQAQQSSSAAEGHRARKASTAEPGEIL